MAIDLVDYETKAREAVQAFWGNREQARQKQIAAGKVDAVGQTEREKNRFDARRHPDAVSRKPIPRKQP